MNKKIFIALLILGFAIFLPFKVLGYVVEGSGDPCAGCSGSYCSGINSCSLSCVNNSCVASCQCSTACGARCCTASDCGSSGSCNYSWQDIGCGQSGGGVSCPSNQMLQKGTAPSYTSHSCSNNTCQSSTVYCPDQYQCVNRIACGANTEISVKPDVAKINDPVSVTGIVNAGSYGVCEDGLTVKINNVTTTGWSIAPSNDYSIDSTCRWFTGDNCYWTTPFCSYKSMDCWACGINGREMLWHYYTNKTLSKTFNLSVPGYYTFSIQGKITSNQETGYISTTSQPLQIKAKYGETADADPTDVSIDKDVYLGDPSTPMTVDSGTVLGSENGNVIIRGQLNLVANANKSNPIRIIYGNQLILDQGAQIYLPTNPDLIGGAYIIKKGKPDPYANNSSASICNSNYDSTRPFKYCGLNKICQNGQCVDYTPSF